MEVQAPTEDNLHGEEAVRLGLDWPTEHDDTTHMKRGYYQRDNGTLGKVVDGVKLTESEDDYSSSQSAKRAKMGFCASESDPSDVGSPKVEAKDEENEEESPVPFRDVCRQTVGIDNDSNEEECGGETDGCS
jgi:hypothetical protein